MFALGLAVVLAVVGIASFPCWPYSERWGYRPSIVSGVLLVVVALVAAGGREPRAVPTDRNVAALPASGSNERERSRKIIFLPRDLETTQRDPGL